jgi:hypothetical protein
MAPIRTRSMFFSYEHLNFRYEPFPIGLAKPLMDSATYESFVQEYPPPELFQSYRDLGKPGNKYTLSERENPRAYRDFVRSKPLWREFNRWIESKEFIYGVFDLLRHHYIDLGYRNQPGLQQFRRAVKALSRGRLPSGREAFSSRFEFSALPADGGAVVPHTDAPRKIVTFVVSILSEGEWNPAFGGGTDVNRPTDPRLCYNDVNRLADFEDMEVLHTYEFTPNQAVIFVKTFNSWHSVRPMTGKGSNALRRTLTINIEKTS